MKYPHIDILTVCGYASVEGDGLTIIRTFDKIDVPKLPWREYFAVAVKARLEIAEYQERSFYIRIFHKETGEDLFRTEDILPSESDKSGLLIGGNIKGLVFSKEGEYVLRVGIDEGILGEYLFTVSIKK